MSENIVPVLDRSIVLVGLMGAGKSSVGRRLAKRLGLSFFDADHEIEAAAGCSIDEIFSRHGEEAFRTGERQVIARLLKGEPHILATGGYRRKRHFGLVKSRLAYSGGAGASPR